MRYFHRSLLVVPRVLTLQTFLWNTALSCPIQPLVTWFMDELVVKFCSSVWKSPKPWFILPRRIMLCSLFEQNARSDARTELEETHHFYRYLLSFVSRWLLYPKIKISKTDPAQTVKGRHLLSLRPSICNERADESTLFLISHVFIVKFSVNGFWCGLDNSWKEWISNFHREMIATRVQAVGLKN